jgi:hypothetical protein
MVSVVRRMNTPEPWSLCAALQPTRGEKAMPSLAAPQAIAMCGDGVIELLARTKTSNASSIEVLRANICNLNVLLISGHSRSGFTRVKKLLVTTRTLNASSTFVLDTSLSI